MSRTWKAFGPSALALTLLVVAGVRAAEDPPRSDQTALEKRVTELELKLETLKSQMRLEGRIIQDRFDGLERAMKDLAEAVKQANAPRVARGYEPPAPTGIIRLDNRSAFTASVVLDGVTYQVLPGEIRSLRKQPGTCNYEVIVAPFGQIQRPVSTTVAANETVTLTINP